MFILSNSSHIAIGLRFAKYITSSNIDSSDTIRKFSFKFVHSLRAKTLILDTVSPHQ